MISKAWGEHSTVLAVTLALIVAVAWRWQAAVFHAPRDEIKSESWDHVKKEYPMPREAADPPQLAPELVESVVRANPFSPTRQLTPLAGGRSGGSGGATTKPPPLQFRYKGRINLGKQRAIVEETTTHKTYFLEVGQEVAGFKVLDIAENRVVLSDGQTKQEVVVSLTSQEAP